MANSFKHLSQFTDLLPLDVGFVCSLMFISSLYFVFVMLLCSQISDYISV